MGFGDNLARADRVVRLQLGDDHVISYAPGVGPTVPVKGVFDAAYVRADLQQPGVSTSGPAVFLTLADLPSDPKADLAATVTVDGVAYSPHEVQPDGTGAVLLHLHKVT